MDYDYSLLPPKCPNCRAMPVDAETPKWMYREYGECSCEETQEVKSCEVLAVTSRKKEPMLKRSSITPRRFNGWRDC